MNVEPHDSALTAIARASKPAPPVEGRVLVIDDEVIVREVFRRTLALAGFDVIAASGGAEGITLLRRDPTIRLVLLDLQMPNFDGWRFRHEQRSDSRLAHIPTIIVTGAPLERVVHAELMAADYLLKPVGREHLISVVESHCRRTGAMAGAADGGEGEHWMALTDQSTR